MQRQFSEITKRYLFFHHMRNIPLSPYAVYRDERLFIEKLRCTLQDKSRAQSRAARPCDQPDFQILATLQNVMNAIKASPSSDSVIHSAFQANAERFASVYFIVDYYSKFPSNLLVPLPEIEATWRSLDAAQRREYIAIAQRNQKYFEDYVRLFEETGKKLPRVTSKLQSVVHSIGKRAQSEVSTTDDCEVKSDLSSSDAQCIQNIDKPCPFEGFETLVQAVFFTLGSDVEEALRQVAPVTEENKERSPKSKQNRKKKKKAKGTKKKRRSVMKRPKRRNVSLKKGAQKKTMVRPRRLAKKHY